MTFVKVNPRLKRRRKPVFVNPFFDNIVNELMNTSIQNIVNNQPVNQRPAVNVVETADAFRLEMAIPGLSKKDIEINVEKEMLTISAKKEVATKEGSKHLRTEFNFNEFERSFQLSDKIDKANIAAAFKNGILILTLAKKEEAKELAPRKITIS